MRLQKHFPPFPKLVESEGHNDIHFTSSFARRGRSMIHLRSQNVGTA